MPEKSVEFCTAVRFALVEEFGVDSFHPWGPKFGVRYQVKAMGGVVITEGLERRSHGCCSCAWKAEGKNLHGYFSAGRGWDLVHSVCNDSQLGGEVAG